MFLLKLENGGYMGSMDFEGAYVIFKDRDSAELATEKSEVPCTVEEFPVADLAWASEPDWHCNEVLRIYNAL